MIGLHLRGRGSQTALIFGPQNLHFKYGGCGLCILEWLVKYCFFYSQYQYVFVALDHFWPKGNELACEPVQHTLLQYETIVN